MICLIKGEVLHAGPHSLILVVNLGRGSEISPQNDVVKMQYQKHKGHHHAEIARTSEPHQSLLRQAGSAPDYGARHLL